MSAPKPVDWCLWTCVAGVVGEAGPQHPLDLLVVVEERRHLAGVLLVARHAQVQRLGPAQHEPGVERRQDRTDRVLHELQRLRVLLALHDRDAAHAVRVAVQELRGRVHDDVGAERERPLEERAHEGVVDDQDRTLPVRDLGERPDVADLHHRVGGRLEPQHVEATGLGRERRGVGRVEEGELDAVVGQDLREQAVGAAVHVVGDDDAPAGLDERQHRLGRRHAGGEAVGVLAPLERREVLLERAPREVVRARVLVALVLPDPLLDVGRGLVDRDAHGSRGGVRLLAGVDAVGREAHSPRIIALALNNERGSGDACTPGPPGLLGITAAIRRSRPAGRCA